MAPSVVGFSGVLMRNVQRRPEQGVGSDFVVVQEQVDQRVVISAGRSILKDPGHHVDKGRGRQPVERVLDRIAKAALPLRQPGFNLAVAAYFRETCYGAVFIAIAHHVVHGQFINRRATSIIKARDLLRILRRASPPRMKRQSDSPAPAAAARTQSGADVGSLNIPRASCIALAGDTPGRHAISAPSRFRGS